MPDGETSVADGNPSERGRLPSTSGRLRPAADGRAILLDVLGATEGETAPGVSTLKRNQIWRHDVVDERLREAVRSVDAIAARFGVDRALEMAEQSLARSKAPTSLGVALDRFASAFAAASLSARSKRPDALARHLRAAVRILHGVGVGVQGSRLSYLHAELRKLSAQAQERRSAELVTLGADAVLRMLERELREAQVGDASTARLARCRVLRLSGALDAADELLSELRDREELGDDPGWERACVQAVRTRSARPLYLAFRAGAAAPRLRRQLLAAIWAYASRDKASMREAPRAGTLERAVRAAGDDARWVRGIRALENAYKAALPLDARIHGIERILDADAPDPEMEALTLGAAARWLARARQPDLAASVAARYRLFCQSLSDGEHADVFGLDLPAGEGDEATRDDEGAGGTTADFRPRYAPPDDARLSRTIALGRDLLRAGVVGWLRDDADEARLREYAEILVHHATVLKGPIQKLGQMLAYYGFPVTSDVSEGALAQLFDDAQPVPFDVVRAVAEEDLGRPLERVFRDFDERPLAAGSIGQVHGATLADGSDVVVKVQYPHMVACVERDFRSLSLAAPLLNAVIGDWDWPAILRELQARMLEECDYRLEAANQERFRSLLVREPGVVVPRVFPALTRRRVFVSERFRGEGFASFAAHAPEADRAKAGEIIARYAMTTTMFSGTFNSDLQPGNLLFGDGRVCFVDFGNVRSWQGEAGACWRTILHAFLTDDPALLERGMTLAKMLEPGTYDPRAVMDVLAKHFLGVLRRDGPALVEKRLVMREVLLFGPRASHGLRGLRPAPEYVYAFRIYWGLIAVLSDLRVPVDLRRACMEVFASRAAASSLTSA